MCATLPAQWVSLLDSAFIRDTQRVIMYSSNCGITMRSDNTRQPYTTVGTFLAVKLQMTRRLLPVFKVKSHSRVRLKTTFILLPRFSLSVNPNTLKTSAKKLVNCRSEDRSLVKRSPRKFARDVKIGRTFVLHFHIKCRTGKKRPASATDILTR